MNTADRRRRRVGHFVSALKRGECPSTRALAPKLAALPGVGRVCARSLQREREWFPGQTIEALPDGGLRLPFPAVPRPELVYWVMSYCGHLVVRNPPDLVAEVRQAGERIVQSHES